MAVMSGSDGTDLLDLLFDHNDGILTNDCYNTDGQQFPDQLKSSEFNFSDCDADELLSYLTGVDLSPNDMPDISTDFIEPYNAQYTNCTSVVSNRCHEDHIYSRSPDENSCSTTSLDMPVESPSNDSAVSSYSYSDASSPTTVECYSLSPVSNGTDRNSQHSPLGGNMEDMTIGFGGTYNSTVFVLQDGQLIEAVATTGIDCMTDDSGLVSLDMVETDEESYSDDDAGLGSINDASLFDDDDVTLQFNSTGSQLPFTLHDVDAPSRKKSQQHKKLVLSEEEKLLLSREGISIPTDVPLTKEEERALKSVRRKIRNKVSAKVSRKRKQEYVDGLEKRVKICSMQNRQLQQKVEKLEKLNQSFLMQLKKLQAMIVVPGGVNVRHAQTGTCIMVLVLSFAFFILPNVGPWLDQSGQPSKAVGPGRSPGRSLLTKDMMLFSAHSDGFSDEEHDIDGDSDPATPNFTPAVTNPFLPVPPLETVDDRLHEVLSAQDQQSAVDVNVSYVIDMSGKETGPMQAHDTVALAVDDDGAIDMSKFPAKNDL